MKMSLKAVSCIVLINLLLASFTFGAGRQEISFPDILGYKTLKGDFHMHTVFSDGKVWPTVRVDEASRGGLDVIAITDHAEYIPHKQDIPTSHNRPYEIASSWAKEKNKSVIVVNGAEITRAMPPGHFNAIFLKDVTPLDTNDFTDENLKDPDKLIKAVKIANEQGAFVFWNHPAGFTDWHPIAEPLMDVHAKLIENKLLNGIEVANGDTYYPKAHRWCLEKNLTMMGGTDVHDPIYEYQNKKHRTITLVFAKGKSLEAVKEALRKGRTAVWCGNKLIGREKYLNAIFKASVKVTEPNYSQNGQIWCEVKNSLCMDIQMETTGTDKAEELILPANSTTLLKTTAKDNAGQIKLSYVVKNFLISPDKGLPAELTIHLPKQ